jgi:hypothetical protein
MKLTGLFGVGGDCAVIGAGPNRKRLSTKVMPEAA